MWKLIRLGALGLVLAASGCAGPAEVVSVPRESGEKAIQIQASSFDFDPDIILADQGDELVLIIENTSGMEHNFTLKDPGGEVLVSRDLPPHETARIELPALESGTYSFLCNKRMHPLLGMKGSLMVHDR